MPAALEYMGMPINTDKGTDHQADFPMKAAIMPSGT